MSGEHDAGSIIGHLKLDASNWEAELTSAGRKADDLARHDPKIKISTNAGEAIAQLETVAAASRRLQDAQGKVALAQGKLSELQNSGKASAQQLATASENVAKAHRAQELASIKLASAYSKVTSETDKLGNSSNKAAKQAESLGQSIPSPLIITGIGAAFAFAGPLIGAGTAALVGFAGAAGTAYLAYKGIKDQMDAGTPLGLKFKSTLSGITKEFDSLTQTAAQGAAPGVLGALTKVRDFLPTLNPLVGNLSKHLGSAFNITAGGVISALKTMSPLIQDAGKYAELLATKFAKFAASSEFKAFVNYARTELPQVGAALTSTGEALVRIGVALHPVGDAAVSALKGVADGINALHVEKLSAVASFLEGGDKKSKNSLLANASGTLGGIFNPIGSLEDVLGKKPKPPTADQLGAMKQAAAVKTLDEAEKSLGLTLGLTNKQLEGYAAITGITREQVAAGTVTTAQFTTAVQQVSAAYGRASASGTAFLNSLATFSQSAGTSADRASLIGATLKAANGDALGYAGALSTVTTAADGLVVSFTSQASNIASLRQQIRSGKLDSQQLAQAQVSLADALAHSELAAINLKTGMIDTSRRGAGPLIQSLQGIQEASMAAASATYQHEVATRGGVKAADDAYAVYVSSTRGSLIDQAAKLGLTSGQARRLADQYFGLKNSGDIKKKIEQIGGDKVQAILTSIKDVLLYIAGLAPRPTVGVNDQATPVITGIKSSIDSLSNKTVYVNTVYTYAGGLSSVAPGAAHPRASGGGLPEGYSTINEQGWELVHKQGSNVQVFSHEQSKKMLPQGPSVPAFAGGTKEQPRSVTEAAGGGAAYGIAQVMLSQVGSVREATRLLSAAVNDAFEVRGIQAKIAATKADLANLMQQAGQFKGSLFSTLSGAVDPSKYTSVSDLVGAYQSGTASNGQFRSAEKKLTREGINSGLLEQLLSSGNSAGLQALAAGSKSDVLKASKAYAAYQGSANAASAYAQNDVFGGRVRRDQSSLSRQQAQLSRQMDAVDKLVAAIGRLTNRPVSVSIAGSVIASAVIKDKQFQGVFDAYLKKLVYS